jgi:hypothetical protein
MIPVPAMILAAQIAMPVADRVPQFNLEPTCKGAATASMAIRSDKDVCLRKEQQARDDLNQQWASFAAADKGRCVQSASAGGIASYIQLLTCLEMAKLARELPKDDSLRTTTGAAPSR